MPLLIVLDMSIIFTNSLNVTVTTQPTLVVWGGGRERTLHALMIVAVMPAMLYQQVSTISRNLLVLRIWEIVF